ncbi:MAG: hypothetical protein IPJ98_24480 [Bryobacterales bacterium]|nr:hypothetical protein [Bryobacterales bacterium]
MQLPATAVPGPNSVGVDAPQRFLPTQYSIQYFFDTQRELRFDTLGTSG